MKANPNYTYLRKKLPEQRITLLQGGTRSGKTYSTIYYLIWLCHEYQDAGMEIDITRDTFTALKATVWHDFKNVLRELDLYDVTNHNRTDHIYSLFGNTINYYGADNPSKIHGRSRDILWVNEAQQFPEETIDQLFPRTRHRIICDYNPALPLEHWLDRYIPQYPPLITTYKDNPHLTKSQIEDIESRKNQTYWWSVYGSGKRAQPEGAIFTNWKEGAFPDVQPIYGMDFGFSVDPTTLVATYIDKAQKLLYLKELIYQPKLTTSQIQSLALEYAGKGAIVADSAEPRLITELSSKGLNMIAAEKGQGSVTGGIAMMQDFTIIVDPSSTNLIKELNNYAWLDKGRISPMDAFNHCIDAARYAVMHQLANPHRGKYYVS